MEVKEGCFLVRSDGMVLPLDIDDDVLWPFFDAEFDLIPEPKDAVWRDDENGSQRRMYMYTSSNQPYIAEVVEQSVRDSLIETPSRPSITQGECMMEGTEGETSFNNMLDAASFHVFIVAHVARKFVTVPSLRQLFVPSNGDFKIAARGEDANITSTKKLKGEMTTEEKEASLFCVEKDNANKYEENQDAQYQQEHYRVGSIPCQPLAVSDKWSSAQSRTTMDQ